MSLTDSDESDIMLFKNDVHHLSLMEVMKSMYDTKELVDITICVQDHHFQCHKNILAAASPYFRAMFTTDLHEKTQNEVHMYDVDASAMELIIQYAYTARLDISPQNAQNLLSLASLLQMMPVHKACARFMETQLDVTNCVGIYCFAIIHNCMELKNKAEEHIEKNFTLVHRGEEFLQLGHEKVATFLGSSELNVEKEDIVFEALMKWVSYDRSRVEHLAELLPLVRFPLLSSRYIQEKVLANEMIASCDVCQKMLSELEEFESNPESYQGEHTFNVLLRCGMIKPEQCVLLIGGIDQNRPSINCYNPLTREAYYMATFQDKEDSIGYFEVEDPSCVVTDDNQIFVAGGHYFYREHHQESPSDEDSYDDFEGESVSKDVYHYDNDHDCWIPKAPMLFPKSNFSLAAVGGFIFCFGGVTLNQHPTEIVEKYNISQNRWSYVGMMPTMLVDLVTVVHNDLIYILGGRTGVGAHNIVMSFDPKTCEWNHLAGMPTPRFKFGSCVIDDEIFVAGGQIYSHTSSRINRIALSSVEIYNIHKNQWRQGPNLPEEIYNVGLFVVNNCLYVCGTTEYHRSSYRVYRYNVVYKLPLGSTVWEQVETDLCDIRDFSCILAKMHTRKLSQLFRPEVDT
ncbi:hypothetical protein LSH36_1153g00045 [Paralvinella palmiformis]|uniref:BTB domain-containing protein n=1 Tax=Paralvinella palmiformis TaxID=53620 RepID=A0AAD9IV66_9ANNE|nr:hypothetical protein LSH36_1153g00045 [Paralvinella palmiformis]